MNALSSGLLDVSIDASPLLDVDITQTTDARIEEYLALGELDGGLRGIPSGFPTIDLATAGFQSEQLITLVGPPKAGKSTVAMLAAIAAHKAGKVPLFLSFEMSNTEQAARHDAFRAGISHHALLTGKLNTAQEKRLRRYLDLTKDMVPFYMSGDISGTTTVSGIAAKVEQYKPDILFVDGSYLLDDEQGQDKNSSQALTNITRSLKRLAQKSKIPVFNTTQVLTWKLNKKKGITSDSIGYSSSFAQDSDVVLGIMSDEDSDDMAKLSIVIARNAPKKTVQIQFDFEVGQFRELGEDTSDRDYSDRDS
jgi:replicative DNA helicase